MASTPMFQEKGVHTAIDGQLSGPADQPGRHPL